MPLIADVRGFLAGRTYQVEYANGRKQRFLMETREDARNLYALFHAERKRGELPLRDRPVALVLVSEDD